MAIGVPDFSSFLLPSAGGGSNQMPNFGSNQYMTFPQQQQSYYPMQNNVVPGTGIPSGGYGGGFSTSAPSSYTQELPSGQYTSPTINPALTAAYGSYLGSQLGQGLSPFNLSTPLPTGGSTAPGALSAPLNPILQNLMTYFQTGQYPSSGGGQGGLPPGVLPMFQSELAAMQIPEQQQLADIQEQFGSRGALGSSEAANAFAQFGEQTTAEQQALLGQLTQQVLPGLEQFGMGLQGLDQNAIEALYKQFYQIQPQYNPLLGATGQLATTFPGITDPKQSGLSTALSAIEGLGSTAASFFPLGV